MDDCIFCKIISGEIPSVKIWEDDNYLAILDIYPNREGVTLVMPKEHQGPDFATFSDKFMADFCVTGKSVANKLKKGLGVKRVIFVIEGLGMNHAHLKLYPVHPGEEEGHLTTELGLQKTQEELEKVAQMIRN